MPSPITSKILERINQPNLIRILAEELSGTELNSLLLEVFQQRAKNTAPALLLRQYQKNRFVKPAELPFMDLKQHEIDLLNIFVRFKFEPVELSPVSVFGSCSVVAPADQNKIISALRGTEVMADATNAIALHCCDLRRNGKTKGTMRFGALQRHVRAQHIEGKGFTPHFKIGCLVTSGVDQGNYSFEKESLLEHMQLMQAIFRDYFQCEAVGFRLLCRDGYPDSNALALLLKEFAEAQDSSLSVEIVTHPEKETNYYKGIQYKVDIRVNGRTFEIADGGFVNWSQQLLQNKKERMLTTGFGFEFMYRILHGLI